MEEKKGEKKGILNNTKHVSGKPLRIWLIVMIIIFMLFTFGIGMYFGAELGPKKNKKSSNSVSVEEKKVETKEESVVPVMDTFGFVHGSLYFIYDGDLYYYNVIDLDETNKWGYDVFSLTHSGCLYDNSSQYCQGNPPYDNKAQKIDGISNVKRIKVFNRVCATDESFDVFAIAEDGNVYKLDNGVAVKFLGENDVEDMIVYGDMDGYEVILKNGKHMIYTADLNTGNFECTTNYVEKK